MKQRTKIILLVVLMLAAAGVFYFDSNGGSLPGKTQSLNTTSYIPLPVENPELQRWKLEASSRTEYKSSGRDLFSEVLPPPPRRPDPVPQPVIPVPTEPPPPTLPANMKFFGSGTVPNGTSKRAFLTDGEEVFIVGEGDTLLGRFRILRISNASLEFEELGSGRRNSAPLDEQAAPPA
ncbi:MAG TPA: hypothetical protein VNY81_00120 [Candidatus Saccharimonadales bacterium]|nr:hypothetical protein [Candidatus Saccharimonadales bacterium]